MGQLAYDGFGFADAEPTSLAGTSAERHQWLERATEALRPLFAAHGYDVPAKVRVTIGWPHGARKAIGQCWAAEASSDKHFEVFVSPALKEEVALLATLAHELVHATVGLRAKHGPAFKRCATAIGLTGKMTATVAGDAFKAWAAIALEGLGPYPAGNINAGLSGIMKQSTRLLKAECDVCGYTVRVTRKWADLGAPHCAEPDHGPMRCEG